MDLSGFLDLHEEFVNCWTEDLNAESAETMNADKD